MHFNALANGIRVLYYPVPTSKSIVLKLYIKAGSCYENLYNNGISHLLEHMHFRRLGNRSQRELYMHMECMGTTLQANTYPECMMFFMKVRPEFLQSCALLLKDILTMYNWDDEDFSAEKRVVIRQIVENENPFTIKANKTLWKHHPLSMPVCGTADSVEIISLSDLLLFKEQCFCQGRIGVCATGNFSHDEIVYMDDLFGSIQVNTPNNNFMPLCPKFIRKPDVCFDKAETNELYIEIYFDILSKLYPKEVLILLNSILGGGVGSYLQSNIREILGVSTDISSDVITYQNIHQIKISYSVNKINFLTSLSYIAKELNRTKTSITDSDKEQNIRFFTDNLWFWLEDMELLNDNVSWDSLVYDSQNYSIDERISRYKATTNENLMDLARILFIPSNLSLVVYGNTSRITQKRCKEVLAAALNESVST